MNSQDNLAALKLSVEMYLVRLLPFLEDQADTIDTDNGRPHGNEAMQLHTLGSELLRAVERVKPALLQHAFVMCETVGQPPACPGLDACHQMFGLGTSAFRYCGEPEAAHIPRAAESEPVVEEGTRWA